jgi:NADPH-dependent 2,4-dienoyl-CoA reductase/sulfur reductase-like enzyme
MPERLLVIGGDAAGMSAASQARRRQRHLDIVVLEKGRFTSYSACGIPYVASGEIAEVDSLVARSPEEFRDRQMIDVRMQHEAVGLDVAAGKVEVRDHSRERTFTLGFDQVLIATGARPVRPDLPGIDNPWVRGVQTLDDAARLMERVTEGACKDVVVVGGGYIGLEMAEAFIARGARVTLVEGHDHLMSTLDPDMSDLVANKIRAFGVDLRLGEKVTGFEDGRVHLAHGSMHTDLAVLGLGVVPNSELATDAGIGAGAHGAIAVDRQQRTDTPGAWAAGDCATSHHRVSNRQVHIALGTVANKQGRVAGINLGGGYASFPGVVGTAITRSGTTEIGRTGLSEREANAAGFRYVASRIETTTFAGYLPDAPQMTVKLLAELGTERVLGAQIVGGPGSAKRIDTAATAITAGMNVGDLVDLDLAYAPPFSSVWDPLQIAARDALRLLGDGG